MPDTPQKFYLTTPIYYVNARPHIGHAYTTLVADTIARRHRLLGDNTFFLTGTDEHGQKIERSSSAAGVPPQQFADDVSAAFKSLWDRMGLTYTDYIRTTDSRHKRGAQKLFTDLHARGQIYLSSYTGQYSIGEEMFVDGPPGTLGPDGRPTETVTEENFFFRLSDYQLPLLDLIESDTLHIQPDARKNEVLSFLRGPVAEALKAAPQPSSLLLSGALQSPDAPSFATDAKSGTVDSLIAYSTLGNPYIPGALRDLSVSRSSFTWGIPIPEPAASETKQKHVIYVWLDALANYMTAVGYGSDTPEDIAKFEKFWPADLHLVGKEIIRFHCVYWPAFLLAAKLPLPKAITAHGWLLFDDSKMSKSKGNIVRTETILDAFGEHYRKEMVRSGQPEPSERAKDLYATDVLRYFLLREIPFGQDGSFSFEAMVTRYNADLANGYGNLVSRTLTMIKKYFNGAIPFGEMNQHIGFHLNTLIHNSSLYFDECSFYRALEEGATLIATVDKYISETAPWKIAAKTDDESRANLRNILYTAVESIRLVTALLYPVIPQAASIVWRQLGLGDISTLNGRKMLWVGEHIEFDKETEVFESIFPRAPKELAQIMTDMEASKAPKSTFIDELNPTRPEHHDSNDPAAGPRTSTFAEPSPGTTVAGSHAVTTERVQTSHAEAVPSGPFAASALATTTPDTRQIAIDDFVKIDLRVAKILVAERIPKADKLLRLEVDLGYERRQILSGIAEWYTPEELIGRRIVIIANLAPRKMRGLESHGMLLAASSGDNVKPILTTFPDTEDLVLGSRVR